MTASSPPSSEDRVLIFAPTGRDAALNGDVLRQAGFFSQECPTLEALYQEIEAGVGVAVLTAEEALSSSSLEQLIAVLDRQPPWSDLPLIILTLNGLTTHRVLETLRSPGTLITLERPVPMSTLVSAVRAALQARRRQYEVRDLLQRLEAASRQKDEFLAMLAHELRNPLAPMSNAIQLLRMRGVTDPTTLRVRDVIERQVQHMCRLVDDLLDVSRLTRGKIVLRPVRLDLTYLVQQTVEDHRGAIAQAGLTLVMELSEEPVWVMGDSTRLTQVLSNLLHNATKFTESGGQIGVRCSVFGVRDSSTEHRTPNAEHRTPNTPSAEVTVRDTGIGMSPDVLPHVFESFSQGDHSLDRGRGGLGLGLTLVQKLIDLHGGEVGARSDGAGRGSEFCFRLPLAEAAIPRPPAPAVTDGAVCRRRVLVVEDNRDSAETLRELLELAGHEVTVAYSGPSGIEIARQFQPEVVLCDLGLPEMDGYSVAAALRQQPSTASARLVALSGYGQAEDRDRSRAAGFDMHLTKPVDPEELVRLLTTGPLIQQG